MTSYIGEIRWFPFDYEVQGWAICDGRELPIDPDTQPLFTLIGSYFGGNGRTTFALPDLRGRAIVGIGGNPPQHLGMSFGMENVLLTEMQMPTHSHTARSLSAVGNRLTANGAIPAGTSFNLYGGGSPVPLSIQTVGFAGYGQAHDNMQPFLVLNACICYRGTYPTRQATPETEKSEGAAS